MGASGRPLNAPERQLVRAAQQALRRGYRAQRHTVASAVRTRSGKIYLGLNIEGIHGPCAEPVALGAAMTAGDESFVAMVAVCRVGRNYPVLNPCGTCRQLLFEYAPRARVLVVADSDGRLASLSATESLPAPFRTFG